MELLGESAFSGFGGQWCSGTDSGEETTPWLPSSLGFWDSLDESSFSTKAFANAESFSQIDMSEAKMALFSFMKETKKMIRANNIAPPAIKKRFLNLSSGRLSGLFNCKAAASCSSVCVSSPNHFSRILIIALLSVTRNIALETLGTKGDPLRNACKNPARVQFRYICCSFSTKSSKDKYKQYLKLQIDRELLTNPKPAVCPLLKGTPILNFFPSLGFSQPLRTVVEQLPGLHAQVIASRSPLLSFGFGFSPPTATMEVAMKVVSSINTTKIDMSGVKMPLFLSMKEMKKMIRADNINTAAIMNSSLNLFSGRLSGSFKLISCSCERYVSSPNHFSIVLIISSLSVTCNIALETSGTKGDPFGNACKNKKISNFSAKNGCSSPSTRWKSPLSPLSLKFCIDSSSKGPNSDVPIASKSVESSLLILLLNFRAEVPTFSSAVANAVTLSYAHSPKTLSSTPSMSGSSENPTDLEASRQRRFPLKDNSNKGTILLFSYGSAAMNWTSRFCCSESLILRENNLARRICSAGFWIWWMALRRSSMEETTLPSFGF
nr:glutamate receptor, ionotropic, plant [Ipomoea batatas]